MKKRLYLLLLSIIIYSCSNPIENANKRIAENFDKVMNNDITLLTSTMQFLYYDNPDNYWYPEETTFKDIISDNYKTGYEGLKSLDERISEINSNDKEVQNAITKLHYQILVAKKALKKKQQSIDNLNSVFGMMFGGAQGGVDFANALSSKQERERIETEGSEMPSKVKSALDDLTALLMKRYNKIADDIYKLKILAIADDKPNSDQLTQIEEDLKLIIKSHIKENYNSMDTVCRNEMTKHLFDLYDKHDKSPIINSNSDSIKQQIQKPKTSDSEQKNQKSKIDNLVEKDSSSLIILAKTSNSDTLTIVKNEKYPDDVVTSYNLLKDDQGNIIYILESPFSGSGDWNIVYLNYFDKSGELLAFERQAGFFNSECTDGATHEDLIKYFDTNFNITDSTYSLTDDKHRKLDKAKCVFNYNLPYKILRNLKTYLKVNHIKN